jgi:hypothetical protein
MSCLRFEAISFLVLLAGFQAVCPLHAAAAPPSAVDLLTQERFAQPTGGDAKPQWDFPPQQVEWITEDSRRCLRITGNSDTMTVAYRQALSVPNLITLEFKAPQGAMIRIGPSLRMGPKSCSIYTNDTRLNLHPQGWAEAVKLGQLDIAKWYRVEAENHALWSSVKLFLEDGTLVDHAIVWRNPVSAVTVAPLDRSVLPKGHSLFVSKLTFRQLEGDSALPAEAAPQAPAGMRTVLFEDFNGPNVASLGSAQPVGGRLVLPAPSYWNSSHLVEVPHLELANGEIHLRVRANSQADAAVRTRLDHLETSGLFLCLSTSKPIRFVQAEDGKETPIGRTIADTKLALSNWHDIRIKLDGRRLTAWVDGKLTAEASDTGSRIQRGKVALAGVSGGPMLIDSIAIFSSEGQYEYSPRPIAQIEKRLRAFNPLRPYDGANWWRAAWLALPESPEQEVVLEKAFHLEDEPRSAFLNVACDGHYSVTLNGLPVERPTEGKWHIGHVADISAAVRKGDNVLQVKIAPQGSLPAMLAVVGHQSSSGEWQHVVTDDSWSVKSPAGQLIRLLGPFGIESKPWFFVNRPMTSHKAFSLTATQWPRQIVRDEPLTVNLAVRASESIGFAPEFQAYLLPVGQEDKKSNRIYMDVADTVSNKAPHGLDVALRLDWTGTARYVLQASQTATLIIEWTRSSMFSPGNLVVGQMTVSQQQQPQTALSEFTVTESGVEHDGRLYVPVAGSEGELFVRYESDAMPQDAWRKIIDKDELARVAKAGLTISPILVRVVDYVDISQEDNGFDDDGGQGGDSRLIELCGETFRVTSPRKSRPPYFVYDLNFAGVGIAHIVLFRSPNDIARVTTVNPIPPETGSGGAYSGIIFPLDNKAYNQMYVYYPPLRTVQFCVINPTKYCAAKSVPFLPHSGAAIGGLWSLALEQPIEQYAQKHAQQASRRLAIDYTEPYTWLTKIYGVGGANSRPLREASWRSFIDYCRLSGANAAYINFIGSDWIGTGKGTAEGGANYNSSILGPSPRDEDYCNELLPLAQQEQFSVIPTVAAFMLNSYYAQKLGLDSREFHLIGEDGRGVTNFGVPLLNPMHPKVRETYYAVLRELAEVTQSPAVDTIAVRVNGFGLSFRPNGGYDPLTLRLFAQETGVQTPTDSAPQAHQYIKAHAWEKWVNWRCQKTLEFWLGARDAVRSKQRNLNLMIMLLAPPQFHWKGVDYASRLENLRQGGFDPALMTGYDGLILQEVWTWENRYGNAIRDWPWQGYPDRQKGQMANALSVWTGYWEQPGVFGELSQFRIGWISSASAWPVNRGFYETIAYGVSKLDALDINLMNWERGLAQQELPLRRLSRAFVPLSTDPPMPFEGSIVVERGDLRPGDLKVLLRGRQISLVNTSRRVGVISLRHKDAALPWRELSRNSVFPQLQGIEVMPFDVLTFEPKE